MTSFLDLAPVEASELSVVEAIIKEEFKILDVREEDECEVTVLTVVTTHVPNYGSVTAVHAAPAQLYKAPSETQVWDQAAVLLSNIQMRPPSATTQNSLGFAEGALLYGGLGTATAATLLTIAHAVLFAGRRKRDLRSLLAETREDPDLAANFENIYANDNNWCGLKLTCELAAKELLSFFKGVVSTEDLQVMSTPELYYSYASHLGFSQGSQNKCRHLYARCPYSVKKMMTIYRTAHSRVNRRRNDHLRPSY
ncbi:uncharacterized protein LOC121863441 [Homarus americanus]|uniref:uncharacterized protein LOC121863441 n=1 Tax=Homarus americanus TaxID=6706 RepID=UPI001C44A402|nr:uncharacterized protein LOC121863441 [Homarus americanus]